jgi:hypothetical protein
MAQFLMGVNFKSKAVEKDYKTTGRLKTKAEKLKTWELRPEV